MLLYSVTIGLSAFLLFALQPIIAKIILPWSSAARLCGNVSLLFSG